MRWKSILLKCTPLLLVVGGACLYPLLSQHAQERSKQIAMPDTTTFRVLLGVGDLEPTNWNGSVKVSGGEVSSIQGWRFAQQDSSDYKSNWKAATRHAGFQGPARRANGNPGPVLENGVLIGATLSSPQARFEIQTPQGSFAFIAQEIPMGESKTYLGGKVVVDRTPSTVQLTISDEEEDFPAIAQSGDDVYLAYVEFTHGDRSQAFAPLKEEPKSFNYLARPVGGDQVMLMHYSKSRNVWDPPHAVSAKGQDVMRAAVAVDGKKRVWVIWSANQKGNFDIYAASSDGSSKGAKWSGPVRVSNHPGTDVNPVAATDAQGRVWVAWQAFRSGNLEILAAVQNGDRFSREATVSFSPASDWDPAIATSANGEVAVSWDTYDKGDYDVYFRRLRAQGGEIQMDAPTPVAASQNFEARSSVAYDAKNRLWVAYEASEKKWGKDFGAYETTGVALYQGHNLKVKCFAGQDAFASADDLAEALPGPPGPPQRRAGGKKGRKKAVQPGSDGIPLSPEMPNPAIAASRAPSAAAQPPPLPLNSFPRLATDSEGTMYLAFRTVGSQARSPVGSTWVEQISYFDGSGWKGPLFVPHTDGLLDGRPALTALAPGHVLMITTSDHRQSVAPGGGLGRQNTAINADLYAADVRIESRPVEAKLVAVLAEKVAPPQPEVKPELDQVAAMRDYRVALGNDKLQIMRGEFHRHTEISGDGGRDGPLIDAYRYMIDAAYMDWVGCCDHDNGAGREYSWWIIQKLTDAYKLGDKFVPMFAYERSVQYPEGHRNVVFPKRGIRPLPRLPKMEFESAPTQAPDTQMLYRYLKTFGGIVASHTSGTDMGTDWRDNDPQVEPVVEIYQGDRQNYEMPDAPRSNREGDSIGGWRPKGFVSLALQKGYRLGFQASSDHISTHMSYCNLWVTSPTREGIMEAFHKRRIYGATDNILADVRSGIHFMGEEFSVESAPSISVKLWGTAPFAKVHIIKDNNYVYSIEPKTKNVDFVWKDGVAERGKTSYYYVRGEQADGELVWVSPMWISYK
jgi:hypothetical protein